MEFEKIDLRLRNPCNVIVSSPSCSGKTEYVTKLLENADKHFSSDLSKIIIVCAHRQKAYEKLENKYRCIFVSSVEDIEPHIETGACVLIDDQLNALENTQSANYLTSLFTVKSHHLKLTIIVLLQVLFSKLLRTCFLNTNYLLVGRWVKDVTSVQILARQFKPGYSKEVLKCYHDATCKPYSFFLFDYHILTPDKFRLRSSAFLDENLKIYMISDD